MAVAITFEQVVETVRQCSPEQREVLSDLMRKWNIEAVRREIAEDAKKSLELFRQGVLHRDRQQKQFKILGNIWAIKNEKILLKQKIGGWTNEQATENYCRETR